ncbi:ArsR/SmtB family transcription factor [Sorangium sp. So ce406]|uniref:ArsR/SmtB family transcription factor n=1 Tax=Sorangium sp. So ce406 TaxID=3133311 RepID=UPI003F5B239B
MASSSDKGSGLDVTAKAAHERRRATPIGKSQLTNVVPLVKPFLLAVVEAFAHAYGVDPVGQVLAALADPTRRQILERVRGRPLSVGDIAKTVSVSRPAVSQHLRVLQEAGLLRCHKNGRQNFYGVDLGGLTALRSYIEGFWDDVLGAFQAAAVEEAERKRRH